MSSKNFFVMSKPFVPEIRFKGYADDWQQAKVREVFTLGNGYTPSKANPAFWTKGTIPWFRMEDIRENGRVLSDSIQHVTPEAVKSSGLFPAGSIIVSTTATIGEHALLIADSLANQRFTVFQTVNRWSWLSAKYLLYRFYGLGDWCRRNVNAGGLAAVNISDLQKYDIDFPSTEEERDSITSYFEKIDELIKETEAEISRLENMKTASLQKMLPRPGETTPEIRFKGYEREWKVATFSDLFSPIKNNTLSRACLNYDYGNIKNIHYGDILIKFGSIVNVNDELVPYVNDEIALELNSLNTLSNGDIIFADTAEDETVGKCVEIDGIDKFKVVSGLHTIAVRPNKEFAKGFLGYFLNSSFYHLQLLPLMQGVKVLSISKSAIADTIILYPESIGEQKSISEYFRNLDSLLSSKRQKLEKLLNLKQSCLDKMFINTSAQ